MRPSMHPQISGVRTCPAANRMLKVTDSTATCEERRRLSLERRVQLMPASIPVLCAEDSPLGLPTISHSSSSSSLMASSSMDFSARKLSKFTAGLTINWGKSPTELLSSSSYVVKISFLDTPPQHSNMRAQSTTRESLSCGAFFVCSSGTSPAMTTTEPASRIPASTSSLTLRLEPTSVNTRSRMPCSSRGGGSVGAKMTIGRNTGWYFARKPLTKARTCCQTSPWQTTRTTKSCDPPTCLRNILTDSTAATVCSSTAWAAVMAEQPP
mmetsp:Transcript_91744/g.273761  ORF Transcript_91744/g.273761 Transcript_91744/m.273761 type:complete len:268 (-) Transcript_91744:324-1127(-)